MRRKVVQHGPTTLTISLPSKWIKEHGVEKGSELTIEDDGDELKILANKKIKHETKHINISGNNRVAGNALAALYKYGYDNIIIQYGGIDELEKIHKVLSFTCSGFEIIKETKNEIHIIKVSELQHEEFNVLFRRIFFFLLTVSEETLDAVKKHDQSEFEKLVIRDQNINKLADLCRRIINRGGQKSFRANTAIYHITEQLERIGDNYKEINKTLITRKKSVSKKFILGLEKAHEFLKMFETIFFDFSLKKINDFMLHYAKLHQEIADLMVQAPQSEVIIFFELMNITRELYNLNGATMILNI